MRLVFTHADAATFADYRERFIRRAVDAAAPGAAPDPGALRLVLDYKYGEPERGGNGLLARWHTGDVAALFMDWRWRRGGPGAPAAADVAAALGAWWSFLRGEGWLDPYCTHVDGLRATADAFAAACREPLGSPALFSGPGRDGLRSRAARLPSAAELAEAIRAAPAFRGDDDEPGAAAATGRAAGWSPRGAAGLWRDFYAAISEDLPDRLHTAGGDTFAREYGRTPGAFVDGVLSALFAERRPAGIAVIAGALASGDGPGSGGPAGTGAWASPAVAVQVVLADLERLGAVVRGGWETGASPCGEAAFGLTPLGEWAAYERLTAAGRTPRTFDALLAEPAEVVVERAASGSPGAAADLGTWVLARGAEAALHELAAVARRTDDRLHRWVVHTVAARYPHAAAPAFDASADVPGSTDRVPLRPSAACSRRGGR
ncbi:hypothetical protein HNR23_000525 [Nocardiopsis mwathae]|uniref:Uncharacterized protein n=1 Tax=Nocardiopsis mwathae TaxID=1472723 RepID=A0A7X0D3X4_9ACTN|nr:hypothetical protein [Nocardiopsis mwathae]MBB6170465.1 hypothetical protein [Nocardiopsis mwathae]